MATIDRDKLLTDAYLWLPDQNILTDEQILNISEFIIAKVGDDDIYYPEVLCKLLGAVADANGSKAAVSLGGLKRQKVRGHEKEYTESVVNIWKNYKKSLQQICPIFGYSPKYVSGAVINSAKDDIVVGCPTDDLYF